jgi:L-tartrate/succinate antiporter
MSGKAWRVAVPILIAGLLAILPVPEGLTPNAWYYFAIFAAVVAGLILEPIPAAAVGVIGVTLAASRVVRRSPASKGPTRRDSIKWALSGFRTVRYGLSSSPTCSRWYEKTGLGRRLGRPGAEARQENLGLGTTALADLVLAPYPSNTARSNLHLPHYQEHPRLYGSTPEENPRKLGSYLMDGDRHRDQLHVQTRCPEPVGLPSSRRRRR